MVYKKYLRPGVNLVGLAAFIVYTIHTFQVHSFWERKKSDYSKLEKELNVIKTQIANDAWCKEVEANIKANHKKGVFKQELINLSPSKTSNDELVVKNDVKGSDSKNIRL